MTSALLLAMVGAWALLDPVPEAARVPAERISGTPTRVIDGDTFDFGPLRVRFAGVDAPEMSTPHGEPARRHLASLIAQGPIRCEDAAGMELILVLVGASLIGGIHVDVQVVDAQAGQRFAEPLLDPGPGVAVDFVGVDPLAL
jgi:hypothetical protein